MICTTNVTLAYGKRVLFKDVNIKFIPGSGDPGRHGTQGCVNPNVAKAGGLSRLRRDCQGFAVPPRRDGGTLGVLALKPLRLLQNWGLPF